MWANCILLRQKFLSNPPPPHTERKRERDRTNKRVQATPVSTRTNQTVETEGKKKAKAEQEQVFLPFKILFLSIKMKELFSNQFPIEIERNGEVQHGSGGGCHFERPNYLQGVPRACSALREKLWKREINKWKKWARGGGEMWVTKWSLWTKGTFKGQPLIAGKTTLQHKHYESHLQRWGGGSPLLPGSHPPSPLPPRPLLPGPWSA